VLEPDRSPDPVVMDEDFDTGLIGIEISFEHVAPIEAWAEIPFQCQLRRIAVLPFVHPTLIIRVIAGNGSDGCTDGSPAKVTWELIEPDVEIRIFGKILLRGMDQVLRGIDSSQAAVKLRQSCPFLFDDIDQERHFLPINGDRIPDLKVQRFDLDGIT